MDVVAFDCLSRTLWRAANRRTAFGAQMACAGELLRLTDSLADQTNCTARPTAHAAVMARSAAPAAASNAIATRAGPVARPISRGVHRRDEPLHHR